MGKITINGRTYRGTNIQVSNGVVYIDGKRADESGKQDTGIRLIVEGDVDNITVDRGDVEVRGNVTGDVKAGGSISCGDVGGSVDAGGSISCGRVSGSVDAGGSVQCGNVGGNVDAGGSIMKL